MFAQEVNDRKREMMKVKFDEGGMKTSESSVCRGEGNMYFQPVERGMEQGWGCRKRTTTVLKRLNFNVMKGVCRNSI